MNPIVEAIEKRLGQMPVQSVLFFEGGRKFISYSDAEKLDLSRYPINRSCQ